VEDVDGMKRFSMVERSRHADPCLPQDRRRIPFRAAADTFLIFLSIPQ
jgi:hypothetical protein